MVVMENIRRENDKITMDCYAEDNKENHFPLVIDATIFEIVNEVPKEFSSYALMPIGELWILFEEKKNFRNVRFLCGIKLLIIRLKE